MFARTTDAGATWSPAVPMRTLRSNDAGVHWSAPVRIAPISFVQLFVPDDDFPIRAEDYRDGEVDRRRAPLERPERRGDGRRRRTARSC